MRIEIPIQCKPVVSTKGQTVIPKEIREAFGMKEGTKLAWVFREGKLRVIPIPEDPVRALRGILKGHGTYAEWLQERNEERRRERKKEDEEIKWRATSSTPPR